MVNAKEVINSIKQKKIPKSSATPLGEIGYDNPRDDIEKIKNIREGTVEKVPANAKDIVNKEYVDDEIDTDITTHKGDASAHHVKTVKYTDGEAVTAMGAVGDANNLNHVKTIKYTDAEVDAIVATHTAVSDAHHSKYTDAEVDAIVATHTAIGDAHHAEVHNMASHSDDDTYNISTTGTLTVAGDAAFDTDTLFVDVSTDRVGIGTTSPAVILDVTGTGDEQIRITTTGTNNAAILRASSGNGTTSGKYAYGLFESLETTPQRWDFGMLGDEKFQVYDRTDTAARLVIDGSGNVGIGTSSPSATLDVNGDCEVNGNHVLEGYSTGRNVMRSILLEIKPGTTAGTHLNVTLKPTGSYGFNAPTVTTATNMTAGGGSFGNFALSANGITITMNLSETIVGLIASAWEGSHDINNSSANIFHTNTTLTGGNLVIDLYKQTGSWISWLTNMAAGDLVYLRLTFLTST